MGSIPHIIPPAVGAFVLIGGIVLLLAKPGSALPKSG